MNRGMGASGARLIIKLLCVCNFFFQHDLTLHSQTE